MPSLLAVGQRTLTLWILAGMRNGFTIVRILIGTLLLAAAALKAHALWAESTSPFGEFFAAKWGTVWMEFEIVLGCWLLWGAQPALLWVATFLTLLTLSAASFVMGVQQLPSCGCFGRVTINPWYTFALDLVLLVLLLLARPLLHGVNGRSLRPSASSLLALAWILPVTGGVFAALGLALSLIDSDLVPVPLAGLASKPLSIEPEVTDLGVAHEGEAREFSVKVVNHSNRAVRVIGGTHHCTLVATDDLPTEILPHDSRPVRIRIEFFNTHAGLYQRSYEMHCDWGKEIYTLQARINATIVETPALNAQTTVSSISAGH